MSTPLTRSIAASLFLTTLSGASADESTFPKHVNEFLSTHCYSCHGPDKQKGKLRLDTLSQDLVYGGHGDDWHEVLDALSLDEMPPEDEPQPSAAQRDAMVAFFNEAFEKASEERKSTGGKVVMRRLTNYEYNNTLNELLGLNEDFSKDFPPDPISEDGFKNNGQYMAMSETQIENYMEAAKLALDLAIFEGPRPKLKSVDLSDNDKIESKKIRASFKKQSDDVKTLYWNDFPEEGPALVEIEVKGIKNYDRIDRLLLLEAGFPMGYGVNRPSYTLNEVLVEPVIERSGDITKFTYLIPKIEEFPAPIPSHPYQYRMFHVTKGDKKAMRGAEVTSMSAKGPYYETWPPESHRKIFIQSANPKNEAVYAKEILTNFMPRAWRRPVTKAEIDEIHSIYLESRKTAPFIRAIKDCLVQILVSPDFLYHVERKGSSEKSVKLSPHELANRLSYFLWSSQPDLPLQQMAASGKLASANTLRQEIKRMLKDERSMNFAEHFTSQWLELDRMQAVAVSPEIYPDFQEDMKDEMRKETTHFFAHILNENMSALNFIDSDFTTLSERLNLYYQGSEDLESGSRIVRKFPLNAKSKRGGILSQASIHLALSDGEDSHVISRAVWFVDKILGDPPPPPPADVDTDLDIEGFEKLSKKQQIAIHVEQKACSRCHMKFDPYGVAFENFDAIGQYRTKVRKLDQEKLDKQRDSVAAKNPEIDFKKIDSSGDGFIQKGEWLAHVKATSNSKRDIDPRNFEKSWSKISNVRGDKKGQSTHPKGTISLEEYKDHLAVKQRKDLKAIQENLPYIYIDADASTTLPDSSKIGGLDDLKAYLLENKKEEFSENLVRRLLSYALGRSLEFSDDQTVMKLTRSFQSNDYKLATLVEEIILSEPFQTK